MDELATTIHLDSVLSALNGSLLRNNGTGLGTARDPYTQVHVDHGPLLSERELRALYRGSWFIRRVVELLPQDMLKAEPNIVLHGDPDDDAVADALQIYRDGGVGLSPYARRCSCAESFRKAMVWARLFGQAYCVLRVNGGENPAKPLKRVRSFEGLSVLDCYALRPAFGTINPDYPEFYQVARDENPRDFSGGDLGQRIHESRVLVFTGAMIHPYDIQVDGSSGHDSVVQQIYEAFVRHYQAKGAISKGLDSYSLFKVAIAGLSTLMQAPNGTETLTRYLNTVAEQMSLHRIVVQDTEASNSEFQERSFTGVAENFKFFIDDLVASTGYPHYKIFGSVDKAALADSGGAETRAWAEAVRGHQQIHLADNHRRLFYAIFESRGKIPDAWEVDYPSIYQSTPKEESDLAKTQADTLTALVRNGIVTTTQAYQTIATGQPLENVCEPLDPEDVLTIVEEEEAAGPSAEEELAALLSGGTSTGDPTAQPEQVPGEPQDESALPEGAVQGAEEAITAEEELAGLIAEDEAPDLATLEQQTDSADEMLEVLLGWRVDAGKGKGKGKGRNRREKPNCTKGRSCGMSCVAQDRQCKTDLSPAADAVAKAVAARDSFDPAVNPVPQRSQRGQQQPQSTQNQNSQLVQSSTTNPEFKSQYEKLTYEKLIYEKLTKPGPGGQIGRNPFPNVPPEEVAAVAAYTGPAHSQMNSLLRGREDRLTDLSDDGRTAIAAMNTLASKGLDKMPKFEGTVYRATRFTPERFSSYQVGSVITEKGFTSTSTYAEIADMFSSGLAYVIKSKRGVNIDSVSMNAGESEVLFRPETKFKVLKVEKDDSGDGGIIYLAEVDYE